jgi:lysophospholipid acyltransferase (LPLAT)-like uncharacterized protein
VSGVSELVWADGARGARDQPWLDPVLVGSNAALVAFYVAFARTVRVVFREELVPKTDKPIIYITWHRMNYAATPVFRAVPSRDRPTFIAHNGVASRAFSHQAPVWLGFDVFAFRKGGERSPRDQIIEYIRTTRRPILNLPDSGGPYGKMKPGILEVARACEAVVVPFVVIAEGAATVGKKMKHVLPMPFARLEARRGALLDGHATAADCQRELDALA